jgi:hypothetical protein
LLYSCSRISTAHKHNEVSEVLDMIEQRSIHQRHKSSQDFPEERIRRNTEHWMKGFLRLFDKLSLSLPLSDEGYGITLFLQKVSVVDSYLSAKHVYSSLVDVENVEYLFVRSLVDSRYYLV